MLEPQAPNPVDTPYTTRAAWEARVNARVLERFRCEMDWRDWPIPTPCLPPAQEQDVAGWDERESAGLKASAAIVRAEAALRRYQLGLVYRWLIRALELYPLCPQALGIRGRLRYLGSDPAACHDFDLCLVYGNRPRTSNDAAMAAGGNMTSTDPLPLRPRTAGGDWDGAALLAAFLHPAALKAAGPHLVEVAGVLRELVVSRHALQRFTREMGWPASEYRGFARLDPRLLDNADSWLRHAHDLLRRDPDDSPKVVDARIADAYGSASRGAPMAAVETALPEEFPACRARVAFIRGEAAWRHRRLNRAAQDFERLAALAPHVTVGHRRLGQIALAKGDFRRAARHFEAAVAIPNQRWMNADQSDDAPQLVGRIGSRLEIYRYRGGLYPVPRTPDFMGVSVVAGRLIQVYDTPAYRLWRRIKPRPEVMARLRSPGLRRRAKRLIGRLGRPLAGPLLLAVDRVPGFEWALRRLAGLFLGGDDGKREPVPDAPGRLMSIVLRLVRPFRRTPVGRLFRRVQASVPARWVVAAIRSVPGRWRLFVLQAVFRAKELPAGARVGTVEELIERMGHLAART